MKVDNKKPTTLGEFLSVLQYPFRDTARHGNPNMIGSLPVSGHSPCQHYYWFRLLLIQFF
jgi:hypothetical protein